MLVQPVDMLVSFKLPCCYTRAHTRRDLLVVRFVSHRLPLYQISVCWLASTRESFPLQQINKNNLRSGYIFGPNKKKEKPNFEHHEFRSNCFNLCFRLQHSAWCNSLILKKVDHFPVYSKNIVCVVHTTCIPKSHFS